MKLLCLVCLLAGGFCRSSTDLVQIYALPNTMASLPCPEETGDVTWSYFEQGVRQTLVTIVNGQEVIKNKDKYGSQADNVLLIKKVISSDSRMYCCNKRQVYLYVTTDPNMLAPKAGHSTLTPHPDEVDSDGSGLKEDSDKEESDPGIQGFSDVWKVLVGVVIGVVPVLLVLLTLRFCSKRREETNRDKTTTPEVIYEEIDDVEDRPGRRSEVESPYWSSIPVTPNTPTPDNKNLYSTVDKSKDPSRGECVYYLAQNPAQTGGHGNL